MIGFKHETTGKNPSIPRGGKRFIIGSSQTWHWDRLKNT
jgi:hypothetical protein